MTFKIGDQVIKAKGYNFPGTVRAVFENHRGDVRVVVEFWNDSGLLHIFSPSQLELKEQHDEVKPTGPEAGPENPEAGGR